MKWRMHAHCFAILMLPLVFYAGVFGQVKPETMRQIQRMEAEKKLRSPAERKISSQLLQAIKATKNGTATGGVLLIPASVHTDAKGNVDVDINADVTDCLLAKLKALGGHVIYSSVRFHTVRAQISLAELEAVAGYKEVKIIRQAERAQVVKTDSPNAPLAKPGRSAAADSLKL